MIISRILLPWTRSKLSPFYRRYVYSTNNLVEALYCPGHFHCRQNDKYEFSVMKHESASPLVISKYPDGDYFASIEEAKSFIDKHLILAGWKLMNKESLVLL